MTPVWADRDGLPTRHALDAAARVASLLDADGSRIRDARETYWQATTGAALPPADLAIGEALLTDTGLAVVIDGMLRISPRLQTVLESSQEHVVSALLVACTDLIDAAAAPALEHALRRRTDECMDDAQQARDLAGVVLAKFDASYRTLVGDIGEEHVVAEATRELTDAGRARLAADVRRVSVISDAFGYDITAPRVDGADRLLEVKTTTRIADGRVTIYLSRHEADVGAQRETWALVICHVHDVENRLAETLGWLRFTELASKLPTNTHDGRWESASLTISIDRLADGIPSAFL